MRALILMLPLCLSVFSLSTYAESVGQYIDSTFAKCKEVAVSTIDSQNCYIKATTDWDAELGNQYKLLMKDQPENVRIALRDSQRLWIKYRDSYNKGIEALYQKEDGSIFSLVAAESKMNVIRDKAIDLYRLRNSTDLSASKNGTPLSSNTDNNPKSTNLTADKKDTPSVDDTDNKSEGIDIKSSEDKFTIGKKLLDDKKDLVRAMQLLTESANDGNIKAQQLLGNMLTYGGLVPKNIPLGIEYIKKAALQNNPDAQIDLGYAYSKGVGVPNDNDMALMWYKKAKINGSPIAERNINALTLRIKEDERYKDGFIAVLNCGSSNYGPNYIDNCFNDSELKITLDNISTVYGIKSGNFPSQSGQWESDGLHIKLTKRFSIEAQNSLPVELLTIKIIDQAGNVVFQEQASQYHVIKVKND
ncbi:lysozyme inhibitor LprI family protein [Enterobacter roggenkampii]|uniref:lysozyme inhibitor LprI family protein n=1 Tax=Enterobacter roggenkampii TaxID=1812935 RepID=UPI0032AF3E3E